MDVSSRTYKDLAATLRLRREIIANHAMRDKDPGEHLEALKRVSERILAIRNTLPATTDPRLAHYLDRCSYDKALALLENRSADRS